MINESEEIITVESVRERERKRGEEGGGRGSEGAGKREHTDVIIKRNSVLHAFWDSGPPPPILIYFIRLLVTLIK